MKRTVDEHAERFDEWAEAYDDADRPVYQAARDRVIDAADPRDGDIVLDIGTGTGAIALGLASDAASVIARDVSSGMLEQAREKAESMGVENVAFGDGRFRDLDYDGPADVVTSNYAMHHVDDAAKRSAIEAVAGYRPRRFVLGDVMFFGDPDPDDPDFDPAVDDPATVGHLVDALTDVGFAITAVTRLTDQAGVIVAETPRDGWDP